MRRRPQLRTSLAVETYRAGDGSLNRAAELAGTSTEAKEFKTELADRGIERDAGFLETDDRESTLDGFCG
ncbi:UPF0175 family protein [Natronolimnohabitans innermongolicus]|uniref:Uncharacterized protein n=1 Tax=Natronolimnohabitans innermongolicus JCM 12255 TaxID=1227499 RepID=L9XHC2_9EURY|nr:UPF0175 family protein [Natronolimnohabitans innermongolicus]ELY61110.1 hypothetical protein C493_03290 [Natronolimnohabitans innermongolicus JCM 12255]